MFLRSQKTINHAQATEAELTNNSEIAPKRKCRINGQKDSWNWNLKTSFLTIICVWNEWWK